MKSSNKKSVFISYSRREAPFADSLLDILEDNGYKVWLDYHSLVPGRDWEVQIAEGIRNADVILLIVSKESMKSNNVAEEQKIFTESGKRVILVLFETVKLKNPKLLGYEWVDFRGNFKKAAGDLMQRIESEPKPADAPPQKGFKVPAIVWVSFLMSIILALISIPLAATVFVPYFLVPLPYKMFKRNFDFSYIQTVLIALPIITILADQFLTLDEQYTDVSIIVFVAICSITMLALLRSSGMRRWGKPIATSPQFSNLLSITEGNSENVTFAVDYAPEDKPYADEFIEELTKFGHSYSEDAINADSVFVLVSTYKKDLEYDGQKKNVFPVILQTVPSKEIDPGLRKIQWIDFRRGIDRITAVGKLLSRPEKMLKAIGATPTSNEQTVLPTPVQAFVYLLVATAAFTFGGWVVFFVNSSGLNSESAGTALLSLLFLIPILAILITGTRSLVSRKGWMKSTRILIFALITIGIIFGIQYVFGSAFISDESFDYYTDYALIFGPATFAVGLVIASIIAIRNRDDLVRWFPARS